MLTRSLQHGNKVLTPALHVCCNFVERGRGLLWRKPLDASLGEALLIPRCASVHTFWMRYPITVIFLDRDRRIMRIALDVKPSRVLAQRGAAFVLECATGTAWAMQLACGDRLQWDY